MIADRSVVVVGIGLVAGFLLALYGFLCMLSAQAYVLGSGGFFLVEGRRAVFAGLVLLGIGLVAHLQSLAYMERRYRKTAVILSIVSVVAVGIGVIGYFMLPPAT